MGWQDRFERAGGIRHGNARRCCFEQMEARQMLSAQGLLLAGASPVVSPAVPDVSNAAALGTIEGSTLVSVGTSCSLSENPAGLPGVRVELLNETGEVLQQQFTGPHGLFAFQDLPPGVYALQQHLPQGYTAVSSHVGLGGGIAFSAHLIGEIVLATSSLLSGYQFCEQSTAALSTQREGVQIVSHAGATVAGETVLGNIFFPPLNLFAGTSSPSASAPLIVSPPIVSFPTTGQPLVEPAIPQRVEPLYGGSSQKLEGERFDFEPIFDELFTALENEHRAQEDFFSGYYSTESWGVAAQNENGADQPATDQVELDSSVRVEQSQTKPDSAEHRPSYVARRTAAEE